MLDCGTPVPLSAARPGASPLPSRRPKGRGDFSGNQSDLPKISAAMTSISPSMLSNKE